MLIFHLLSYTAVRPEYPLVVFTLSIAFPKNVTWLDQPFTMALVEYIYIYIWLAALKDILAIYNMD